MMPSKMGETVFKRWLSDRGFAHALSLKSALQIWARRRAHTVELRSNDSIVGYRGGRSVFQLGLAGPQPELRWCGEPTRELNGVEDLADVLAQEADWTSESQELTAQAGLFPLENEDFECLDQQVAIPRDALTDRAFTGRRVDLLLLNKESGALWLVEVKLAAGDDLHDALSQLDTAARLPEALLGGRSRFTDHYTRVCEQKRALGLVDAGSRVAETPPVAALLIIGDAADAQGRIVYWHPDQVQRVPGRCALSEGSLPSAADFCSLSDALERARRAPRSPYAPRKSRHTAFAKARDRHHASYVGTAAVATKPFESALRTHLLEHNVSLHSHVDHPRSSQAFCLQVFGLAWSDTAALAPLSSAFASAAEKAGLQALTIEQVNFEAPHSRCPSRCALHMNVHETLGEGSKHTSLDVWLAGSAREGDRPVRVGVGVEFKYSEPEFGACGGFVSAAAPIAARQACVEEPSQRPAKCHLLQLGRTYLTASARERWFEHDPLLHPGPCELLGPQNQLFRSHYTAAALGAKLAVDKTLFVIVHDGRNEDLFEPELAVWNHKRHEQGPLARYIASLRAERRNDVSALDVATVLRCYSTAPATSEAAGRIAARYGLSKP